MLQNILDMR